MLSLCGMLVLSVKGSYISFECVSVLYVARHLYFACQYCVCLFCCCAFRVFQVSVIGDGFLEINKRTLEYVFKRMSDQVSLAAI